MRRGPAVGGHLPRVSKAALEEMTWAEQSDYHYKRAVIFGKRAMFAAKIAIVFAVIAVICLLIGTLVKL